MSSLKKYDVYPELSFKARRDLVNGSAPSHNSVWHTGNNDLGKPGKPYFLASGYGPKYLSSEHGYQVIQPLVQPKQAEDLNYTISTLSLSRQTKDSPPLYTLDGAAAFEVVEGALSIQIGDFPLATLLTGDVAFIPAQVPFTYYTETAFTKVLFVASGNNSLDQQLISGGQEWNFTSFPKY
jgi:hypothetical protein